MNIWESIFLGVVQGMTEFLPISSSGHLVLLRRVLGGSPQNLQFEIMVHMGTLLAIIVIFRTKIIKVLSGILWGRVRYKKGRFYFSNQNTRLAWLLVLASLPVVLIGIIFGEMIEKIFLQPFRVGVLLLVTGGILFGTKWSRRSPAPFTWWRALVIGLAQALALLPGISRSGSTICAGIYLGIEREESAEFSFLLAVPAVIGAGVIKLGGWAGGGVPKPEMVASLVGAGTAAVSGYFAIKLLLTVVKKGRLASFSYYCWLVGLFALLLVR